VPVERHRLDAQDLAHPAHGDGFGAAFVRQCGVLADRLGKEAAGLAENLQQLLEA
jgi:hypothetical protein